MVIRRKGKRGWAAYAAESVRNIVVGDDGDGVVLGSISNDGKPWQVYLSPDDLAALQAALREAEAACCSVAQRATRWARTWARNC